MTDRSPKSAAEESKKPQGEESKKSQGEEPKSTAGSRASDRQARSGDDDAQLAAAGPDGGSRASGPNLVGRARRQYIVAPRRGTSAAIMNVQPLSAGALDTTVRQLGLDVVKVIRPPRQALTTFSVGTAPATDTYVARIEPDRAELLKSNAPQLIVAEDHWLEYGDRLQVFGSAPMFGRLSSAGLSQVTPIAIQVLGEGDQPVQGASVQLAGDALPADGVTDGNGNVSLNLVTLPGGTARSLYINLPRDYWDTYITNPALSSNNVNVVRARSLRETMGGFPDQFRAGWGHQDMGLDQLPENLDGSGIKIAIIDSGCDNTHPLLQHVRNGIDLTDGAAPGSWTQDTIGHGTHCAGVITARASSQLPLRGFAPAAEVIAIRTFPGGRFSSIIEALDQCMALGVDVVNMSLGGPQVNLAVEQKIEEVIASGVACVVAVGNSGGPVQYPASSPQVLGVAALGRLNQYPDQTWDAAAVDPTLVTADGYFSPTFTCHGPEVEVCAPGVAIISTVPGSSFEPQSGTSMAAPHVTGLAALLLAHHPIFQGPLRQRNRDRVLGLYNMILSMCVPLPFGRDRAGIGMPRLDPRVVQTLVSRAQQEQPATAPQSQPGVAPPQQQPTPFAFAPFQAGPMVAPQFAYPQGFSAGVAPLAADPRLVAQLMGASQAPLWGGLGYHPLAGWYRT
jgi:subtilisin family serine protease